KIAAADLAAAAADGTLNVEVQNSPDVNLTCAVNEHHVRVLYRGMASPIAFGPLFIGMCDTRHLLLVNRGLEPLNLEPLSVADAAFHVSLPPGQSLSLPPRDSVDVTVEFCPLYAGSIEAQLLFASNDPDEPRKLVALRGEGVVPPDVALTPGSISQALL